jgi:hypothetical protein
MNGKVVSPGVLPTRGRARKKQEGPLPSPQGEEQRP